MDKTEKSKSKSVMSIVLELLKNQEDLRLILDRLTDEDNLAKKTLDLHSNLLLELMTRITSVEETTKGLQEEMAGIKVQLADIPVLNNFGTIENALISRIAMEIREHKAVTAEELLVLEQYAEERKNGSLFMLASQGYSKNNNPEFALAALEKAISFGTNSVHVKCRKGQLLHNIGKYSEAEKIFRKIEESSYCSDHIDCRSVVLSFIAMSLMEQHKYGAALSKIDESIKQNNKSATAWWAKGRIFVETNRFVESLGPIEKSLEINPKFIPSLNDKAIALSNLGRESANEALKILDDALSIDKNNQALLRNKGLALQRLGKDKEAIEVFDKAINLDEKRPQNYCSRALSKCNLKDSKGAIVDFKLAEKFGLNCERYHECYAEILLYNKKYGAALIEAEKDIKKRPNDISSIVIKLRLLKKTGKKSEIPKIISEINARKDQFILGSSAAALDEMAILLCNLGTSIPLGIQFSEAALKKEPNDAEYLDTLGCLLSLNGQDQKSLETFEKALKFRIYDDDITWSHLAKVYERLGKKDSAEEIRKKYIDNK